MVSVIDVNVPDSLEDVYKEKKWGKTEDGLFIADGYTIKGRKELGRAMDEIKDLLRKGVENELGNIKFKALDVRTHGYAFEISLELSENGDRGICLLKFYGQGKKKKDNVIMINKCKNNDNKFVSLAAENVIKPLVERFVLKTDKKNKICDKCEKVFDFDSSLECHMNECLDAKGEDKPQYFKCDICMWETKFKASLKAHKTRIHSIKKEVKCTFCDVCFENMSQLEDHIKTSHREDKKRTKDDISPSNSPPSKRPNNTITLAEAEHDLMEIEIEATEVVERLRETQIQQLEEKITSVTSKLVATEDRNIDLQKQIDILEARISLKMTLNKVLSEVHEGHLSQLRGYKVMYETKGDGMCLINAAAVHLYESEEKAKDLRKVVNKHIIDNWDFYCDLVEYPFSDVIGVGKNAKKVTIPTKEEMIPFLQSEDALYVYANMHDIQALANIFNMNIHIFTYKNLSEGNWNLVSPVQSVVSEDVVKMGNCIQDMALYNSNRCHFDLLLKDESRLVLLNSAQEIKDNVETQCQKTKENDDLLLDVHPCELSKDLSEEILLLEGCNLEENTILQTQNREEIKEMDSVLKCSQCDKNFQSEGILKTHMEFHSNMTKYLCEECKDKFLTQSDLEVHVKEKHTSNSQWGCGNCSFLATSADQLLNHLKESSHQPHKDVDKRKVFEEYKQCYTCKSEFDGFLSLMNHRKNVHPSNKKCRNFPLSCKFGNECWYVHENRMDIDVPNVDESFKCNFCDKEFKVKNDCMHHKKVEHTGSVSKCDKFKRKECFRSQADCWFIHDERVNDSFPDSGSDKGFYKTYKANPPPDQLSEILLFVTKMNSKMEEMENHIRSLQGRTTSQSIRII